MRKVIVYGLGKNFYFGYQYIKEKYNIIAYSDIDGSVRKRWADSILYKGEEIISPEQIKNYDKEISVIITIISNDARQEIISRIKEDNPERQIILMNEIHVGKFLIDPLFFQEELSKEEKMRLFSENVEHITIEVNEKCNRKCWFCPNSIIDRISNNHIID